MNKLLLILTLAFILGCNKIEDGEALYEVTFQGMWSADSHPIDFPLNNHFSRAVGMSHNDLGSIFQEGELASAGIEDMAETGGTDILKSEIKDIISQGNAFEYIKGIGLNRGYKLSIFEFKVSESHPYVSLVSMIAPSPDWFVGINNVLLYVNGVFLEDLTVEGILYDSGTDSGINYTSSNDDTKPPEPISLMIYPPIGDSISVESPVAKFEFKRIK